MGAPNSAAPAPAASKAARSLTQSTPVTPFTKSEPENSPGRAFSSSALYVRNGTP